MELNRAEADLRAVGGDPALADALSCELTALFQCAQVKQPAAGVQVLFNKDKALPPQQQRPNHRGVRVSLWCCGAFPAMWGHRAPPARPQPRGNPV